jgi:hypothetical protein
MERWREELPLGVMMPGTALLAVGSVVMVTAPWVDWVDVPVMS